MPAQLDQAIAEDPSGQGIGANPRGGIGRPADTGGFLFYPSAGADFASAMRTQSVLDKPEAVAGDGSFPNQTAGPRIAGEKGRGFPRILEAATGIPCGDGGGVRGDQENGKGMVMMHI